MRRLFSKFVLFMGFSSLPAPNALKIGHTLKQARIFSNPDIVEYSKLSYDSNPVHFDIEYARKAGFNDILVPGMLVASLFPRIIASHFPGAVYVSQTLHFRYPTYVGEEIRGEVQATEIREVKNRYIAKFSTKCFKHNGCLVIDGEATTLLPCLIMEEEQYES